MQKKFLLFACLICCLSLHTNAQINTPGDNIIPPSPEAAQLAKYVQIPVGLYTGVPNISVPLWELKDDYASVPVSLSYHASGNRVEDIASWVGLGWTLNAGGAITRTVRGKPDEFQAEGFLAYTAAHPYNTLHTGTDIDRYFRYQKLAEGCADSEPDNFFFNFNGLSGRFSFKWGGELVVSSEAKIKVTYVSDGTDILSWTVTAPDGTAYVFKEGERTRAQDVSTVDNVLNAACRDIAPITTWYLSEIQSPDKQSKITFTYTAYSYWYQLTHAETNFHRYGRSVADPKLSAKQIRRYYVDGMRLSKIQLQTGASIEFISSATRTDQAGMYNLDQVIVKDIYGAIIRKFLFTYDYATGRLSLRQLRETSADGASVKAPYQFNYNPLPLPAINSYAQDHWGFYNNNYLQTLVPSTALQSRAVGDNSLYYFAGADRSPDPEKMQAGMLTKIIYPAGGRISFEYEPHDYSYLQGTLLAQKSVNRSAYTSKWGAAAFTDPLSVPANPNIISFTLTQDAQVKLTFTVDASNAPDLDPYPNSDYMPYVSVYNAAGARMYYYTKNKGVVHDTTVVVGLTAGTYQLRAGATYNPDNAEGTVRWTELVTDPNQNDIRMGGGLRIKRIIEDDGSSTSPQMIRNFNYRMKDSINGRESSSGVIFSEINYVYFYPMMEQIPGGSNYVEVPFTVVLTSSRSQLGNTQGSAVGYRQVTVTTGLNGEGGKEISTFYSAYDYPDDIFDYLPFPPNVSEDYRRGLVKQELTYKYAANQYTLVKKKEYAYDNSLSAVIGAKFGLQLGGPAPPGVYDVEKYTWQNSQYYVYLGFSKPIRTTETMYEAGAAFVKDEITTYDPAMQFRRSTTQKVSRGKDVITEYYYPQDYVSPSAAMQEMKNRNMLPLTDVVTSEKGTDGITRVISATSMQYNFFGTNILPSKLYKAIMTAPMATFQRPASATGGIPDPAVYAEVASYNQYTAQGDVQEIKPRDKETQSYIWGYNNTAVIAKVDNASLSQVAYCDFEDAGQGGWTFSTTATNYSTDARTGRQAYKGPSITRNIDEGSYKLSLWAKAAGGTGTIVVNGLSKAIGSTWTYCEWEVTDPDLIIINPQNYFIAHTGSLSITTNGNLIDGIRLHPKGSVMETYTYDPLVGMTSSTTSNNTTTYFEYDNLGRVAVVRDQNKNIVKQYDYKYARQ